MNNEDGKPLVGVAVGIILELIGLALILAIGAML